MNINRTFAVLVTGIVLSSASANLVAQDVYLLYSSKTKKLMKLVKKSMSGVKVKTFNAMLLAVSDYSGKQKAMAKFDRAKIVIILGTKAAKPLKNAKFSRPVVLVDAPKSKLGSKSKLIHMLSEGTASPKGVQATSISKVADIVPPPPPCMSLSGAVKLDAAITKTCKLVLGS